MRVQVLWSNTDLIFSEFEDLRLLIDWTTLFAETARRRSKFLGYL